MNFRQIAPGEVSDNLFECIGKDWMLITAGNAEKYNTMTASWGQMGVLWNKPVATIYVRPQRYTREFVEREERFSLSFFTPGTQRATLNLLGKKSGRDGDKITEAGLSTVFLGKNATPAFEQASMVFVCRKLYQQDISPECFLKNTLDKTIYPAKDYHRMYTAEIEGVFVK